MTEVTEPGGHRSIAALFLAQVARNPDREAYLFPTDDGTGSLTWRQTADRVAALAAGLIDLGIAPEDRVAILASTRIEWILADTAVMCAGAATTTVYPSTEPGECAYILDDSGSVVVFAEDAVQVAKVRGRQDQIPGLRTIVVFDADAAGEGVVGLAELEARGRERLAAEPDLVERTAAAIGPEQLATLIYTSGTTGTPKGVRLVHANWVWEAQAQADSGLLEEDDVQYIWLPLAHSFGKTLLCGQFAVGFRSYVDGRLDAIIDNLATVRPMVMAGAPRIFEKVHARVTATATEAGGAKARIFTWAFGVGRKVVALRERGQEPTGVLAVQFRLADRLVFSKIRERFGGRIRGMVSGSAALPRDIAEWFHAAGLPVLEGYGLTETSAGAFVNRPDRWRLGTVGLPLGDLEVRIAEDGEVLLRGGGIMRGYHNLPAATAETTTDDGWLRTGDIGELDADGFLRITDRKKDLVKTSGGKYIAPSHMEGLFKVACPYASQAVVHTRNYCTLLVTLDPDAIRTWADHHGLSGTSYADLTTHPDVRTLVQAAVDEVNTRLNRWETVKRFAILPEDLSIEGGELTPSLKIRRAVVEKKYASELDAMYREPAGASAD